MKIFIWFFLCWHTLRAALCLYRLMIEDYDRGEAWHGVVAFLWSAGIATWAALVL